MVKVEISYEEAKKISIGMSALIENGTKLKLDGKMLPKREKNYSSELHLINTIMKKMEKVR
jgi:hypothetical protein